MRVVAIIQARMTSKRLPGKVLMDVGGSPMLERMVGRVCRSTKLEGIWVATTANANDDPVAALCKRLNINVFRGDEKDVLSRYREAADKAGADPIVRLTADCPLIDPALIDCAIGMFIDGDYEYVSNVVKRTYPDGLDVEVFSRVALERAFREASLPEHREHVTPYMYANTGFKVRHLCHEADFSHVRWTVDTAADLGVVRQLFTGLPERFGWQAALAFATKHPELLGLPAGSKKKKLV